MCCRILSGEIAVHRAWLERCYQNFKALIKDIHIKKGSTIIEISSAAVL